MEFRKNKKNKKLIDYSVGEFKSLRFLCRDRFLPPYKTHIKPV